MIRGNNTRPSFRITRFTVKLIFFPNSSMFIWYNCRVPCSLKDHFSSLLCNTGKCDKKYSSDEKQNSLAFCWDKKDCFRREFTAISKKTIINQWGWGRGGGGGGLDELSYKINSGVYSTFYEDLCIDLPILLKPVSKLQNSKMVADKQRTLFRQRR